MIESGKDLLETLRLVYPQGVPPPPLHLLYAAERVRAGEDLVTVAREFKTLRGRIQALVDKPEHVHVLLKGPIPLLEEKAAAKYRRNIGQLLLGSIAERAFEDIYKENMATNELVLEDARQGRSDTDYRVLNGQGRPVFRINIKFHGSQFQNAIENVGLKPEDCFALATYKINAALEKQEAEHLPYIFLIVGVPDLRGATVGQDIPEDLVHLACITFGCKAVTGKRAIEDAIVTCLAERPVTKEYAEKLKQYYQRIRHAAWYALSARKALKLLRDEDKLFKRCFALRLRGFARNWPNAEVDMHFSLREDLTPLPAFFEVLQSSGLHGLVSRLERGTI